MNPTRQVTQALIPWNDETEKMWMGASVTVTEGWLPE